ncbi:thioredoxin fold domain-containing protein [Massilia sp. CCM 8695]|uniref:Thiol:disulfide interchange protein n=1 Tax=Massilia frigida TaxID=2609281 RepID=A0ABX0NGX8_9BURK|nr:DsbC family protein [Massilia frigida]NHZ81563.1 thioredoxin fold domain-containing protein [Massilia frigida]
MLNKKIALLVLTGLFAGAVSAKPSVEETIRKRVEPKLGKDVKIESIRKTPYSGLYEIRAHGDIIYTDKRGKYLIFGQVVNTQSQRNLTKERVEQINMIKFNELPFEHALKLVKGDGKRMMAIFEDPNCGYCKRFRQTTLKEIDNVTVYTFMYNILSEDSSVKSKNIWCAPDRNKAWDDWMLDNKAAPAAAATCASPNEKVFELGRKLRIEGTPAIFFADGSRIPGAIDTKGLEAKFTSLGTPGKPAKPVAAVAAAVPAAVAKK